MPYKDPQKSKEDQKRRYDLRKSQGLCTKCGKRLIDSSSTSYCEVCLEKKCLITSSQRERRIAAGNCRDCGEPLIDRDGKQRCYSCSAGRQSYNQQYCNQWWADLRDDVFVAYGGYRCVCCGETRAEFLQIDHIDGNGRKHREEVGEIYSWLRRNNFPPGFQVLCSNCNFAKGKYGKCPHKQDPEFYLMGMSEALLY